MVTETNRKGIFEVDGRIKILREPTQEYLDEIAARNEISNIEQSLQPSQEEIEQAEFETKLILTLTYLGVI